MSKDSINSCKALGSLSSRLTDTNELRLALMCFGGAQPCPMPGLYEPASNSALDKLCLLRSSKPFRLFQHNTTRKHLLSLKKAETLRTAVNQHEMDVPRVHDCRAGPSLYRNKKNNNMPQSYTRASPRRKWSIPNTAIWSSGSIAAFIACL